MIGAAMNRPPQLFLAVLCAGLVAGCGTPQINRIERNRDIYETWPIDVQQAVLDGKVEAGMTPDQVRVSWGEPTKVVTQGAQGDEIWVYEKGGSDGSVYYPGGGMGNMGGMGTMGGPGIGITTGRGGTAIGATGGIGIGGSGIGLGGPNVGMGGGGIMGPGGVSPIVTPPTPPDVREVVFRNGVVYRADSP
jgi:hypothetical protein